MLYKVKVTGHRGEENIMYMDEKTLKSLTTNSIVDVEIVKPKADPPNNDDDWSYHQKVF